MITEKSAGAIIFRREDGRVLYLLLKYGLGHWDFPKGNIEKGEKEIDTVKREVFEETGITDLTFIFGFREVITYFYRKGKVPVKKTVVFYLAETRQSEVRLSYEHKDFAWLPYEEAYRRLTYKSSKELLRKAHEYLKALGVLDSSPKTDGGGKRLWIMVDPLRCSGCRLCEVACSLKHEGIVWPEASRIRVFELTPGVNIPVLCYQCPDYPCVKACPNQALSVDEATGAVKVDPRRCDLSGDCIEACPAKIPRIPRGKDFVVICDLCGGDPECVKVCNMAGFGALKIVEGPPPAIRRTFAVPVDELSREFAKKMFGDDLEVF